MSLSINHPDNRPGEQGNVLFLILIAVVLFAALSYAVTRSGSNSSGSADNERNRIVAAQLVQYPAGIRMAIVRMVISGTSGDSLRFDPPADFGSLSDFGIRVFHPAGGGATHENAPADMMESGMGGIWYYNAAFEIQDVGLNQSGGEIGNDIVGFLPGIKKGICATVNENLGLNTIPVATTDLSTQYKTQMVEGYVMPVTETVIGSLSSNGTAVLTGQPFGCFQNNTGEYVYYHVLADR